MSYETTVNPNGRGEKACYPSSLQGVTAEQSEALGSLIQVLSDSKQRLIVRLNSKLSVDVDGLGIMHLRKINSYNVF